MKEIIVHTQEELDAIPKNCVDKIIIKSKNEIVVSNRYFYSVKVCGLANIKACNSANVVAYDSANVVAYGLANVVAYDSANVVAYDSVSVNAYNFASVTAYKLASVAAYDFASVVAYGSANVVAYDSANVTAYGNCQVLNMDDNCKIQVSGTARIAYPPKTVNEFFDYYGIKHTDGKATLYKAVHKSETGYFADYNNDFTYRIGETIKEKCDSNVNAECSSGIHVAYLDWALHFGETFDDLAILEVVTDIDKIVVPKNTDGKVRTSEVYVVREVPLEECGVLGSIIARRIK